MQEGNADLVKSLFSQATISSCESFNKDIDELLVYFEGDFVSYDDRGGPVSERERDNGNEQWGIYMSYDIITTKQTYRIAIQYC